LAELLDTGSNSYLRVRFVNRSVSSRRVNMRWSASLNCHWYESSLPSFSPWSPCLRGRLRVTQAAYRGTNGMMRIGVQALVPCLHNIDARVGTEPVSGPIPHHSHRPMPRSAHREPETEWKTKETERLRQRGRGAALPA
jgi:hypothetical protein